MEMVLSETEIRVLGCLMEKEITTPEYYPLSLNALIVACNQKTNRDPVVSYSECTVAEAIDRLREKGLIIDVRDARVPKYDNYFADSLGLNPQENAVMCVLMLRGAQTPGEIRGRAERMHDFAELSDVEATLDGLAARQEGPLVVKLPRQPGHKENRYACMLGGDIDVDSLEVEVPGLCSENERFGRLETELETLRDEVRQLREQFVEFRKQFE